LAVLFQRFDNASAAGIAWACGCAHAQGGCAK
jgi:hypothetical protein